MTQIAFALAAGAGAAIRHAINQLGWTWRGTLLVNAVGSAALGWLLASAPSESVMTAIGVGLLGSLTTFSMFAIEVVEARRSERLVIAASTLACCVGGALLGHAVG